MPLSIEKDTDTFAKTSLEHASHSLEGIQEMPISEAQRRTAEQLLTYSLEIEPKDVLLIKVSPACGDLANAVVEAIMNLNQTLEPEERITYRIQIIDKEVDKVLVEGVSDVDPKNRHGFALPLGLRGTEMQRKWFDDPKIPDDRAAFFHYGPGSDEADFLVEANKVLIIRERREVTGQYSIDEELEVAEQAMSRILTDVRVNERRWCLIVPPTENSVRPTGMNFEEYREFYYRVSARDWEKVDQTQAKLVEKLRGKKTLLIQVPAPEGKDESWRTNITMDIEGKVFANSVAKRNMPGSEVFSSPNIKVNQDGTRTGTANGIFAIPNPLFFKERIIPDLRLVIKDGKVVEWSCSGSQEDLEFIQKILDTDEGASWIGEIGIGTNPLVDIPVPDILIAEKSFGVHLAIGKAYEETEYLGTPVVLDNGNRSSIHIDLPLIMKFAGQIIVDDEVIFDGAEGGFLDPELAYLNGEAA